MTRISKNGNRINYKSSSVKPRGLEFAMLAEPDMVHRSLYICSAPIAPAPVSSFIFDVIKENKIESRTRSLIKNTLGLLILDDNLVKDMSHVHALEYITTSPEKLEHLLRKPNDVEEHSNVVKWVKIYGNIAAVSFAMRSHNIAAGEEAYKDAFDVIAPAMGDLKVMAAFGEEGKRAQLLLKIHRKMIDRYTPPYMIDQATEQIIALMNVAGKYSKGLSKRKEEQKGEYLM
jgi:hypothetical protein